MYFINKQICKFSWTSVTDLVHKHNLEVFFCDYTSLDVQLLVAVLGFV